MTVNTSDIDDYLAIGYAYSPASGGNTLSVGAMTFTFCDTLGDVSPITIDVSRLTGPESVAVAETVKGHSALDRIAVTRYYRTDPE